MPDTIEIGSIKHTKGDTCKSCFNGFPYDCISAKCDGYLHGHQTQLGASMKVETACDICGDEWSKKV
jgi:hypothetical protein